MTIFLALKIRGITEAISHCEASSITNISKISFESGKPFLIDRLLTNIDLK